MFQFLAGLLAFFYSVIPDYSAAIALLTLSVMLVLSPLTLKSTRSMLAMQKLQPEMKALQTKHKGGDRQKLNEEMMALYKDHKVNPVAGCLPMLLQMPVFLVMYNVISGLTKTKVVEGVKVGAPKYLDESSDLYRALEASGGAMKSFGLDLAQSASDGHSSFLTAIPFFLIVALVVFTQYIQIRQTMSRNTKAASPQQQIILKVMPGFFGLISLSIPAAVNVYFLVSALFRIGQTGAMYRFDPALSAHAKKHAQEIDAKATEVETKGKKQPPGSGTNRKGPGEGPAGGKGGGGSKAPANGSKPGSNRAGQPKGGGNGRRPPPRPQQKRSKKGR